MAKYKAYSLINVAGLAIGITCCFLAVLFIKHELSYDRQHQHADHIFRVAASTNFERHAGGYAGSPGPLLPALMADFPEIEKATRIFNSFGERILVAHGDKRFYEPKFFYADADFFQIFSHDFIHGDPQNALADPNAIVITESIAKKYFGEENPLNELLTIENKMDFKIAGVIKDVPATSHFTFDLLAAFPSLSQLYYENFYTQWGAWNFYTYVLLSPNADAVAFDAKLPDFFKKHLGTDNDHFHSFFAQPLTRIHLHSQLINEIEENGSMRQIYFYAIISLMILLIACFNFMNLATARSMTRAKEVGVRKVVGANRGQLIKQFLGESVVMAALAFPIALALVDLVLPSFSALVNRELALGSAQTLNLLSWFLAVIVAVGFLGGIYPAFFLSSFAPAAVLKTSPRAEGRGKSLRSLLVVLQFAVSGILIYSTIVVSQQLSFIRQKDLGFDKEQVLSVPLKPQVRERIEAIKNELLKNSSVLGISASSFTPNSEIWHEGFSWENGEKDMMIDRISADADFFKLFNVQLLDGRAFSKEFINDPTQAYILNEAAVKFIGWNSALGQEVAWNGRKGTVVGVAKDFHYKPLRDAIQPLLITNRAFGFSYLCIKIQPDDIPATVDFLRQTWSGIVPDYPFEYHFFDQDFDRVYKSEERMGAAFSYFSGLAIFIACLGLLGLSWFAINQRTKEIGIRKVLGATLTDIVYLISRDFVKLVIIASLIGLPVAYWAMNQWLNNFAYRIEPGWGMFGLSLAIGLLTALLTVASQSVRAALADPVETLRYE